MVVKEQTNKRTGFQIAAALVGCALLATVSLLAWNYIQPSQKLTQVVEANSSSPPAKIKYRRRYVMDSSGFATIMNQLKPWRPDSTLAELSRVRRDAAPNLLSQVEQALEDMALSPTKQADLLLNKTVLLSFEGEPKRAYETLVQLRSLLESDPKMAADKLYSVIYLQGLMALRRGENENCIMCRGESSCILPITPAARHQNPDGSQTAIAHFNEYLAEFPEDLEVRYLLNVAHMTLGEYPDGVDPRFRISLDHYDHPEFDIGRFRDIGHLVGVNHLTEAGGSIMDDFDNDGLLDLVVTSSDPAEQMLLLHNTGTGTFEDLTAKSGFLGQTGGLNCVQTDYNNDGFLDVYVIRGAWFNHPMRQTLLRNNCNGTFTDVTKVAGLLEPINAVASQWADYDNDGWLDLIVCGERQCNRLYHNLGNGKFKEVAHQAGLASSPETHCKGAAWIDFDNDGYPDLFQNYLFPTPMARLFHNNRDGTFTDVTTVQGIQGPMLGFSCWAWDYDNDGWQDLFATCFERTLENVVLGLMGKPHKQNSSRLYRNLGGHGFEDVTKEAGLDMVFSAMGSNFGDFDNDGYLDMYLGTGEPDIGTLVPNRMFKNVAGKRFAEITSSSGTGNLQKGHGVACGDWDRDGNTDIFIEMGGAIPGDKYHNILFQNPGSSNHWLTVKLQGVKSNRAAIGARIKVVTSGSHPQTIYRHVSSGSSFGANSLQQTIGLADAEQVETLEIYWPTSGTTQVFNNVAPNQAIAITEFATDYEKLEWTRVPVPTATANDSKMKTPP